MKTQIRTLPKTRADIRETIGCKSGSEVTASPLQRGRGPLDRLVSQICQKRQSLRVLRCRCSRATISAACSAGRPSPGATRGGCALPSRRRSRKSRCSPRPPTAHPADRNPDHELHRERRQLPQLGAGHLCHWAIGEDGEGVQGSMLGLNSTNSSIRWAATVSPAGSSRVIGSAKESIIGLIPFMV